MVVLHPVQLVSMAAVPGEMENSALEELVAAGPAAHPASSNGTPAPAAPSRHIRATDAAHPLRPALRICSHALFKIPLNLSIGPFISYTGYPSLQPAGQPSISTT